MRDTQRLLSGALQGDSQCETALFARHLGRLSGYVRARMSTRAQRIAAPEDIVQETHLEAVRKLHAFEDQGPASFYRWLVAMARFKLLEADRAAAAKKRQAQVLNEPVRSAITSPSARLARRSAHARLNEALAAMDDARAEAVRLRYFEGLSVRDTAEAMERSASAVKALVARGLTDLAGFLRQDHPSEFEA